MLAIVFFQESRPILVELEAINDPPAHERISKVLRASGYEETPASFVLLATGQDVVIAEIETAALADLAQVADENPRDAEHREPNEKGPRESFAEEVDAVGTWAPVVPSPLADLIEAAEAAAFPEAQCECEGTMKKTLLFRAHVGRCRQEAHVEVTRDGKRVKLCGDCTFPTDTDRKELAP